ncbi:MAG: radical SAM protein [Promethearchaeota archaeon]
MAKEPFKEKIRVSSGTAIVLGLLRGRLDAQPTTAYLLTYRPGRCSANCSFCPQAKSSRSRADALSRVTWPLFPTPQVITKIEEAVKTHQISRVCLQTLNDPTIFMEILGLTRAILSRVNVPISVSCQPLDQDKMQTLADAGIDRITIPLDAANKELFETVKGRRVGGPYVWETQLQALRTAVEIMGRGHVGTHLIVGLGETEREITERIQWCVDNGVYPGLFAFTPIPGTFLEKRAQPPLASYRRLQVAHDLLTTRKTEYNKMHFRADGTIIDFGVSQSQLLQTIDEGSPFETSGCPGCNRPYYNEKPSGPIYNYPRPPLSEEIIEIKRQLGVRSPIRLGASHYQD